MENKEDDIRGVIEHDFVVVILSAGRAGQVSTVTALRQCGYEGPYLIVVSDDDEELPQYEERFGKDKVVTFNKKQIAGTFDAGTRNSGHRGVVYARNACWQIVRDRGYRYFWMLDDDYRAFRFNYDSHCRWRIRTMHHLTDVLTVMMRYYIQCPDRVRTLCWGQGGDFIGGGKSSTTAGKIYMKRKAMNTFLCDVERPCTFLGWSNEDVNMYVAGAPRGEVYFTVLQVRIEQQQTQKKEGGMTELYLDTGTYLKSMFSVLYHPSGVRIRTMGNKERRIHHRVLWNNTAPKILAETWRKGGDS